MDKKQKRAERRALRRDRGGFSVVDVVILLLVLVAVAGVVYRVVYPALSDAVAEEEASYVVNFEIFETHMDILGAVRGGDAVYVAETNTRLGYIGYRAVEGTEEYEAMLTVTPVGSDEGPNRAIGEGQMVCTKGRMQNGALLVSGSDVYMTPGSELEVRTDRALFTIRITAVEFHG